MSRTLKRNMSQVRAALVAGTPYAALDAIDELTRNAGKADLDDTARHSLEPALEELRILAQASLKGAQKAAEQVRAIVQAARSLETYDSSGRRNVNETRANTPQRF